MLKGLSRKTRGEREGIPQKAAFPASTCEDGYKYLRGGLHVLARTDARTCRDGCTYLQGRMQVRARRDASTCEEGCSALQGGMQCTAGAVAVHCRDGCSALRLRWVKLALKSSSPILDRRKGRKDSPHMGHCSPQAISAEPLKALYKMRHFL